MRCVAQDDDELPTVYCSNAEFMRAMPRHDDRKIYLPAKSLYVWKPRDRTQRAIEDARRWKD